MRKSDCIDIPTRDRFLTNYVCTGRPVVIKGGVRGLPQSEWDFDGLLHRVDLDFRLLGERRRRVSCGDAGFHGPGWLLFLGVERTRGPRVRGWRGRG